MDEAGVIDQVRAGRPNAFGEIVEQYQAPIFRHLLRMTGDYEVASDLAQDTFLKPESTEGGRRVSVLRRQEGAPVLLG